MKRNLLILLTAILCTACINTHSTISAKRPTARLSTQSSVFIAVPERGNFGSDIYYDSGNMTAEILASTFARKARRVAVANAVHSKNEALAAARSTGSQFLVYPKILHWEDRATEWSGKRDKVSLKIIVFDVSNGAIVADSLINGHSKFITLGGDHPQELLPEPIAEFVYSLY